MKLKFYSIAWPSTDEFFKSSAPYNFGWLGAGIKSTRTAYANPVYAYHHGSDGDAEEGRGVTGGVFFDPAKTNYPAEYVDRRYFLSRANGTLYKIIYGSPAATASITRQPANVTVAAGQSTFFPVAATSWHPLSDLWPKNGIPVSRAEAGINTIHSNKNIYYTNGSFAKCYVSGIRAQQ